VIRITNTYCAFIIFAYYMGSLLTASLRKQFIQTVRFIYSDIDVEFKLIPMNVRIEQRVFTVRQVGRVVTTSPSRLTMSADV
jgi:hypothetical protein